jgi:hypothetical protein
MPTSSGSANGASPPGPEVAIRACATMSGMSLTKGPGPLSTQPAGQTNYAIDGQAHRLLFESHPRRFRAEVDGVTVLDTVGGRRY